MIHDPGRGTETRRLVMSFGVADISQPTNAPATASVTAMTIQTNCESATWLRLRSVRPRESCHAPPPISATMTPQPIIAASHLDA